MTTTHPANLNNTAIDSPQTDTSDREIVATRLFDAPRELVFKMWTQPQHIAQWWGPKGFTNTIQEMDVKPGGVWRFVMHGPDGVDYPNRIVFEEVVPVERLAYLHGMDAADAPPQFHVTVTLDDQGGKTWLTMRMLLASAEERAKIMEFRAEEGLNSTLDCLEEHLLQVGGQAENEMTLSLPSDLEIVLMRDFNAPPHLVFAAWTQPQHIRRWWSCNNSAMPVCEVDLRVGGTWRNVLQDADGTEHGFHGEYREIDAPTRLVHTMVYEAMPEHEALVTVVFEEHEGKTRLIETTLHKTTEARDGHLNSGMAEGIVAPFAALDELLAELA